MARTSTIWAFAAVIAWTAPALADAQAARAPTREGSMNTPGKSGRIEANGISYYYEVHGSGEPLLLLHGGLGSIEMFGPVLPMLAEARQVIAVDLQGHGRTPLGGRGISLVDMGDDMAVVLEKLGVKEAEARGYSLGGGCALRVA